MSFSGGVYTLPGPALNTGEVVSATENNTFRNDVATAFNLTMLRNGTSTATANLPMGGYKLTGLAAGSANGDSVRYEQFGAPPAIGNATPNTGKFTTVEVTANVKFPDASTQTTAATGFGFKNRIINGAMMIDQRNAGASVTPTSGQYLVDRFYYAATQSSKFTAQQNAGSVALPNGFTNYLGFTTASAVSVGANDTFYFGQVIEGVNAADLGWGASTAAAVTLSFWVRSSLTGTFGGSLVNSAGNRSYVFSYTISSANTWEQKTVTIAGDTTGTWLKTNGIGIQVWFGLGSGSSLSNAAGSWNSGTYVQPTGSVSVVGTNGATFYITGVQLEKGSTATSFDYRPYGQELALCQRYYQKLLGGDKWTTGAGAYSFTWQFKVSMRSAPTVSTAEPNTSGANTETVTLWATSAGGVALPTSASAEL